MSVAFWSCELKGNKPFEFQPPEGYVLNLQQVALVTEGDDVKRLFTKTLSIADDEEINVCLCTLRGKKIEQCSVNVVFGYDAPVSFYTTGEGKGTVHLSGYLQPGPELDGDMEDDEDDYDGEDDSEDDEDDEEPDSEAKDEEADPKLAVVGKKALMNAGAGDKKQTFAPKEESEDEEDSEDEDESDGSDSEDEAEDAEFVKKMIAKTMGSAAASQPMKKHPQVEKVDAEESSEEDSEEDDDSEEGSEEESDSEEGSDEESDSEEEPPVKSQKTAPQGKVVQQQGKPQQQQGGSKPNTPANKQQQQGKPQQQHGGSKPNTPANKPQFNNNNNQKSGGGDKRKRDF